MALDPREKARAAAYLRSASVGCLLIAASSALKCLVDPFSDFSRHDSGDVELGTLCAFFLLELGEFG